MEAPSLLLALVKSPSSWSLQRASEVFNHYWQKHQTGKRGSFFKDSGHGEGIVLKVATACFSL